MVCIVRVSNLYIHIYIRIHIHTYIHIRIHIHITHTRTRNELRCGGRVLSLDYIDRVGALAKKYNLKLHMDGARLFNACSALNESPVRVTRAADSVWYLSMCVYA